MIHTTALDRLGHWLNTAIADAAELAAFLAPPLAIVAFLALLFLAIWDGFGPPAADT